MSKKTVSMDEALKYISRFAEGDHKKSSHAMFYFLYKEILVNRLMIFESEPAPNKANIEHTEKIINDLNMLLMKQLEG